MSYIDTQSPTPEPTDPDQQPPLPSPADGELGGGPPNSDSGVPLPLPDGLEPNPNPGISAALNKLEEVGPEILAVRANPHLLKVVNSIELSWFDRAAVKRRARYPRAVLVFLA